MLENEYLCPKVHFLRAGHIHLLMFKCGIPQPLNKTGVYSELRGFKQYHTALPTLKTLAAGMLAHFGDTQKNVVSTFLSSRNNFLDGSLVLCYAANSANLWVDVFHESC